MNGLDYQSARILADSVFAIYMVARKVQFSCGVMMFLTEEFFVMYTLNRESAMLVLSAIDVAGEDGRFQNLEFDLRLYLERCMENCL